MLSGKFSTLQHSSPSATTEMPAPTSYNLFPLFKAQKWLWVSGMLLLTSATVLADYLFSTFQRTGFYLSESLLFSTYWLLFLVSVPVQFRLQSAACKTWQIIALIPLFALMHLLIYPALIWLLSALFYAHTFGYLQTFRYGLTAYLNISLLLYSLSAGVFFWFRKQAKPEQIPVNPSVESIRYLRITDRQQTIIPLAVEEIAYISATPPYCSVYHQSKKYLYSATLRSLESRLDGRRFIRVHKSHLVNMEHVRTYQSRKNGDYDLTLSDGTQLRISRNYAKAFRNSFDEWHRLTQK